MVVSLLDDGLHFAKTGHAIRVGVFRERPEAPAEGMVFRVADVLATEENHLVPEQRVLDFGDCASSMRAMSTPRISAPSRPPAAAP